MRSIVDPDVNCPSQRNIRKLTWILVGTGNKRLHVAKRTQLAAEIATELSRKLIAQPQKLETLRHNYVLFSKRRFDTI